MPFLAMSIVQRTNFKYLQLHLDWDLLTRFTCSKRRKMTQIWILLIYFWGPWSPLPNPSLYRTHSEHLIPDTTKPCLEFFVNPQQWLFDTVKSHFEVAQFLRCQRQTKNYNPQENLGLWLFFALLLGKRFGIICAQWSEVFALNAAEWAAIGTLRDLRTDSESSESKSWLRWWNRDFFTRNPPLALEILQFLSIPEPQECEAPGLVMPLCPHHQPQWAVMSRNKLIELFEVQHSTTKVVSGWVVWVLFLWELFGAFSTLSFK